MTKEEFDVLWALNAEGNYFYAKKMTEGVINLQQISPEGDIIDLEYCIKKYERYLEAWNSKWKGTEERWIPKDKNKKTIEEFMASAMYMGDYKIMERPNDQYLFNGLSKEELQVQLQKFKEIWQK